MLKECVLYFISYAIFFLCDTHFEKCYINQQTGLDENFGEAQKSPVLYPRFKHFAETMRKIFQHDSNISHNTRTANQNYP